MLRNRPSSARRHWLALAAGCCFTVAMPVQAQTPDPGAMADRYAAQAKQNAELMQKYTWKMRVQITYKGDEKPAALYQMNYANGQLEKTRLSAPPKMPRKRGIRGRIEAEKIEEFQAWAGQLTDLVKRYMAPTPGTMMDFYAKATFAPMPSGNVRASGSGFIQAGDAATYWIDPETHRPVSYNFTTALQGDPVTCSVTFRQVPGGPQYASTLVVSVPAKEVVANVTNFEFQLNQ